jgi:hypothetical protein
MSGRDLSGFFRLQLQEFVLATRGLPHRSVLQEDGVRLIRLLDGLRQRAREECREAVD